MNYENYNFANKMYSKISDINYYRNKMNNKINKNETFYNTKINNNYNNNNINSNNYNNNNNSINTMLV